ncbi:cyclopropane-fatty-acyl-phospholipid synthase family protein [Porticoccaceae bacterium]|nr:cyclopropane-fatty-acyl-phospholipid synthase family protein [Porticoccaceae bacterium]
MSNKNMSAQVPNASTRSIDRWCRSLLIAKLEKLEVGEIQLIDSNGSHSFGYPDNTSPLTVTLNVTDQRFYSDIAFGGTVAAGEAYIQGYWSCSNLTDLIRIMIGNRHILEQMEGNLSLFKNAFLRLAHWLNRNSQAGSRRNIEAHYDLGNEMFELFLDPTMMYSCAYYPDENTSLEQASLAKLQRICDKLQLNESDHVIEIGTGWGGFALYAAQNYGCKVTTTTISQQQHDWAKQRIIEAGLEDKITLLMEDYRDLQGTYDKLVSIEMIEAVGHQYLDTYFAKCSSLLKPEGIMLIQSITIADQQYDRAIKSVDFIQRFIFPGGFIPSVSAITSSVKSSTDMRLFQMEDIGPHYATTLRDWRQRFFDNIEPIKALGYSKQFTAMWDFYLCYCEAGFLERVLGNAHLVFIKPKNRIDWTLGTAK